jgi:menaquinone-dependent protoporphyrinogen oxidase
MTVLVTAASKHGSTDEIARIIAGMLDDAGLDALIRDPETVDSVERFEAVVIGSAVYMGGWLAPAIEFVERFGPALAERPVWLFSSGPIGEPPKPDGEPRHIEAMRAATNAVDHRIFAGRLVRSELGVRERIAVKAVGAAYGDFRAWMDIAEWAQGIATHLLRTPARAG